MTSMLPTDAPAAEPSAPPSDTKGKKEEEPAKGPAVGEAGAKKDDPPKPPGPPKRDLALSWLKNKIAACKFVMDQLEAQPTSDVNVKVMSRLLWAEARASFAFEISWNRYYPEDQMSVDNILGPELTPEQEEKIKQQMAENVRENKERNEKEKADRIAMGPAAYNKSRRVLKKSGKSAR